MHRAIGYVRVSTDDQTSSGLSLDHQQARIHACAVANQFDLVEIIVDPGVSAGKPPAGREGQGLLACLTLPSTYLVTARSAAARSAGYV